MARKAKTVRSRIFSGYIVTIALIVALVAISSFCLLMIGWDYNIVAENRDNQAATQQAISAHYDWLDKLSASIQTGVEFSGSLDPTKCSLGKWMAEIPQSALDDPKIKAALDGLKIPHESIHNLASPVLELSKTDSNAAYLKYTNEIKPQVTQVINDLNTITSRYGELAGAASYQLKRFINLSLITSIFFALAAAASALTYANSISKKISKPIAAVADWSQHLSVGKDNIDFGVINIDESAGAEIIVMVDAFRKMAESIQENVNVVRRVADGDMTAFVNIRSRGDSLGQNLYKMVQSNDLLFAEILQIAHTVANGSEQIARASQSLAESTNTQASAVSGLSSTIDYASGLIENNTNRTKEAAEISNRIQMDAKESSQKLADLLRSMEEIREASNKVSAVIKAIDDIAFQTNILALNAAVEAARAGEAGKGFAVVANEVRQLALKSAEAVTASRKLIDNTISKTHEGNRVSQETANIFQTILGEIEEIVKKINDISESSDEQIEGIGKIRIEISQISQAASSNAAISQESAASSEEMLGNADLLRQQMSRFNLRKRQMGQAYIPPEKRNDPEFIQVANEHYQRSVETGKIGFELEEPFTEVIARKKSPKRAAKKAASVAGRETPPQKTGNSTQQVIKMIKK